MDYHTDLNNSLNIFQNIYIQIIKYIQINCIKGIVQPKLSWITLQLYKYT